MVVRIGILETGAPPADLTTRFGSYGEMFQRFLGPSFRYVTFDVCRGVPAAGNDCEAYLVTGSAAGVHDGDIWIETLKSFLREIAGRTTLVGFCFGHQLMAEAFGGCVTASPKGWGIGLHKYDVRHHAPWMDDARAFAIPASHRDQVVELPEGATVLAASTFTPFAALLYPERRALSFQGHPEFAREYASALIEARRGAIFGAAQTDEAIASLQAPNDSERVASWIRRFIELACH